MLDELKPSAALRKMRLIQLKVQIPEERYK